MTTLYHYCSNKAFHSIIENRKIWLSSLSLSNDSMEGKLVAEILAHIAKADGLDQAATQPLQTLVSGLEQVIDGLGFCLSEDGDLLSQWAGMQLMLLAFPLDSPKITWSSSQGLAEARRNQALRCRELSMTPEAQENLIKPTYIEIKKLINEGAFKFRGGAAFWGMREVKMK